MKVKTKVKSGGLTNHNEALVRVAAKGLKVKTSIKSGRGGGGGGAGGGGGGGG
jgi:hypothetical protein